jgi:Protein of unknown function (DUF4232)
MLSGAARTGVAGIAALALVASSAAATTGWKHGPSAPARMCTRAQLKVSRGHSGVAAGTVGGYIGFTNRGEAPCRLSGWPTLVAVSADGTSRTALHHRSTMFGPRPNIRGVPVVILRHGERADAVFTGSDIPGPGETSCRSPFRWLRVTPPGGSRSVVLTAWLPALAQLMPNCGDIEVSMVVPASALYHG